MGTSIPPTLTIKKGRVQSINISFDNELDAGNLMSQSQIAIRPMNIEEELGSIYVFVDLRYETEGMSNDFKMLCEMTLVYHLTNKREITKQDLHKCIDMTREHLQSVIDAIFFIKNTLTVSPIALDEISDILDEHLRKLR